MTADIAISAELRVFVNEYPFERRTILDFMVRTATELPAGARVLDVGAGNAPYAELFGHVDYRTSDWDHSVHAGARRVDYVGSADRLPLPDGAFDAVICTQVLEHVAEPAAVVTELYRILRAGGCLYLTVPLVWELHEEPYDFYRYTPHGLRHLLYAAGFAEVDVRPRNDSLTTIAQMLRNAGQIMGRQADGRDAQRNLAAQHLRQMSDVVASYASLDTLNLFPLGYAVTARRPLPLTDCRRARIGAFAAEILETPELLHAYTRAFSALDDATLVVLNRDADELSRLVALVEQSGLDAADSADLVAIAGPTVGRDSLDALLSSRAAAAPLDGLSRFDNTSLLALRAHVGLA